MSSPAPLLRPPVPGGSRSNSGSRAPKLGLAIPPSPSARPVNTDTQQTEMPRPLRPNPPALRLATPFGSSTTPQDIRRVPPILPPLQVGAPLSTGGSSETSAAPRSGSSGEVAAAVPSVNMFAQQLRQPQSREQLSAVSSSHSEVDGLELPDLNKLSLDKGRPLDVDDLDEAGWRAASKDNKIKELGSLGEGAGGAVTRSILEGGKTVFALKVSYITPSWDPRPFLSNRHRLSPPTPILTFENKS